MRVSPGSPRGVLIISYYFPPSGGPGVQRVLKFVRYLPEFGYRPVVLTVPEDAAFPVLDPSLLAEVPAETRVYRSPIREFYDWYRRASGRPARDAPVNLTTSAERPLGHRARWLNALRAAVFIPDGRAGWLPGGVREGLRACRDEKIELIFASGPPFTAHWIGRRLAEKTGLPLVLDFRDPWTRAPFYPARPTWARRLDERLERSCVLRARAVITVGQEIRRDLLERIPGAREDAIHVIPNGFDPADFAGKRGDRPFLWTLAHTGTLPNRRFPMGLLHALRALLENDPDLSTRMQMRLAGHVPPDLEALFGAPPLDRIIRLEGYKPHQESVQLLLDSHLLLLLIEEGPGARGILTGKLFEYLGSRTPILALAPEGEAADLIRRTGAGRVVDGNDAGAVEAALREALRAHEDGRPAFGTPDQAAIQEYSRPRLTERLAGIMNGIR